MRRFIVAIAILLPAPVMSQTLSTLGFRHIAMDKVLAFQDQLNYINNTIHSSAIDSLVKTTRLIVSEINKVKNLQNLKVVPLYFSKLELIMRYATTLENTNSNKNQIEGTVRSINRDISYKLSEFYDSAYKTSRFNLATLKDISINVYIDGKKQDAGKYRLNWSIYRGGNIESYFNHNSDDYNGGSLQHSNPYTVNILLPGIITFWLEDAQTNIFYKPDVLYREIKGTVSNLDISFTKLTTSPK